MSASPEVAGTTGRQSTVTPEGWFSRDRSLALVLVLTSAAVGYLCYRLIAPFLPALAGALALAVMAHPVHRRVKRSVSQPDLAAGIAVLLVALLIVAPAIFVTQRVVSEAARGSELIREIFVEGRWRSMLRKHMMLRPVEGWIDGQLGLQSQPPGDQSPGTQSPENILPRDHSPEESSRQTETMSQKAGDSRHDQAGEGWSKPFASTNHRDPETSTDKATGVMGPAERATEIVAQSLASVASSTAWVVMQLLITCMTTFYFFRDRRDVLNVLRSLLPLTRDETDKVFTRIDDTIHATIYGSVTVALVQGAMGGLMFWFLGLPSPLLWGSVMAALAVIPLLGTFVIWMPTALILALQGHWWQAAVLVGWGAVAIGLIDNLLYPLLVGKRMRLHTLLVFFAIVGGIMLFGTSGIILGPLVLASADALIDIWRRRTAFGGTVEEATVRAD